ncbi:nucleosome assembly protein 1-like 1 isoform X1 [Galleria mellonella]|uniref:Nucleosome assembly protein 1-like 1 isoform X1 n=1 Tax=Galleria mellonella TaxID=7137 RepID=A0A6J1WLA3_GALME|nr:nucleosome assembly protein 1-like 1 isoform X1 [Galleria mellonella]
MGTVERSGDDHTSEVESGEEEEIVGGGELAQHLMKSGITRNEMLAAITNRIHVEALASLPPNVRRRIRALRTLQKEFVDIEAKFYSEVHALECKYEKLYKPLFEKRAQIVSGSYEPTDEECLNPWRDENEEEELARAVQGAAITDGTEKKPAEEEVKAIEPAMDPNVKGIPDFWYTIFRNVSMLCEMMQEHDEPILKCLQDIKVQMHDDPIGFTLEFYFAPNDYFTNTVLTKEYSMKCKPDEENPLEFEGPEIYSCKGCEINWKKGKNVTVKTIKKKQKHKSRGSVRTVTKSVQADSFFNFFSPPAMPDDPNSTLASDIQALLTADFEIGHYIRERVVSRAVLLYTGEGLDEDDDDDYEEEEEEECSTEESEDDEPAPRRRGKKAIKGAQQENPAECKQQ